MFYEFVFSVFVTSALRGASSKRKRSSLYAGKSASQEFLSMQKEKEKEEKKAQSMDNLDGNCNINFTSIFFKCNFFFFFAVSDSLSGLSTVYSSSKQPDLLPKSALTESIRNDEEEAENRYFVSVATIWPHILLLSAITGKTKPLFPDMKTPKY